MEDCGISKTLRVSPAELGVYLLEQLPQGTISTPLFIGNKIIIGYDNGLDLYQVTPDHTFELLDRLQGPMFDATPTVWNDRIYAASKDGYLYCLGE